MAPYTLLQSQSPTLYSSRRKFFAIAAVLLFILIAGSLWYKDDTLCQLSIRIPTCTSQNAAASSQTFVYQNIVVASDFVFHFDVWLALVWTIQRVMKGHGHVQVYGPTPFAYDFDTIVDKLGLYHGSIKNPAELMNDIRGNTAIDLVIFGTCTTDLGKWHDELLAAWDARDDDHKFQLACTPHHHGELGWHPLITPWARRNSIRLLPISQHVGGAFWKEFKDLGGSLDPKLHSAGLGLVPINTHVPILDLPHLPDKSGRQVLTNAVIQGSFAEDRRAYPYTFENLIRSLHENPTSWGYRPLGHGPSFIPDTSLVDPPFKLHLVGSGWIDLPPQLKNVVQFHVSLNYSQYYDVMAEMDVCVPAFGPSDEYYALQASSTVAMCLEVNVPILATPRMREAYTHINDDRVSIAYPSVMTEIDAIIALRTQSAATFLASDPSKSGRPMGSNAAVQRAVEKMMAKGWVRSKKGFEATKSEIWAANEDVVKKMLLGLP